MIEKCRREQTYDSVNIFFFGKRGEAERVIPVDTSQCSSEQTLQTLGTPSCRPRGWA